MDTLDKFLVKEFLTYFFIIWVGLSFLFIGVDFFANFWSYAQPTPTVLTLYGYRIPLALQMFFPVACLMAVLMVLANMSRQNEILALYSSGVGYLRILSTCLALVATLSTVTFILFDSIVPVLNKRRELIQQGLDPNQDSLVLSTRGDFWYRSGNLIYNVGQFNSETNALSGLRLYRVDPNSWSIVQSVRAKEARYQDSDWVVEKGVSILYSKEDGFPIAQPFDVIQGLLPEKPTDFKTLRVNEDMMRLKELRKYISRNSAFRLDTISQRVVYHERLALVFTPIILVLMGLPFGLKPLKTHSMSRSIGFCFLLVFVYLLLFRLTLSMGKGGQIPPVIAGWAPNLLFMSMALFWLRKPV